MRVFVTGANGFIGSHLSEALVRHGYQVQALCEYNSFGSHGWLEEATAGIDFEVILGDIRDSEFIAKATSKSDIVIHLASLVGIPHSYVAPRSYFDTNLLGTLNILEACRIHGFALVHTSTSEVYGNPERIPIDLNHKIFPQSPYAASKASADALVMSYLTSFDLQAVIVRPFNTFGPRQSMRAIIPTIFRQLLFSPEVRLGSLEPSRDLTYVMDTVRAFQLAVNNLDRITGNVIQLGTGKCINIGALVKLCTEISGIDKEVVVDSKMVRPQNSEITTLVSDPSSAYQHLGWRAEVSLEDGLRNTFEWIKNYSGSLFGWQRT